MARLFSGRISNNLLRLEIYSSLVMPGVISPSSSNYERKEGKQATEEISKGEKRIRLILEVESISNLSSLAYI